MPKPREDKGPKQGKKHIRIYGPYEDKTSGRLVWYVYDESGRKYIAHTKTELAAIVDKLTTSIKGD